MRNRNMKNDKVVRAIALALSSVLASGAVMPAMTAYAAEDGVVVETVEETAVEQETKVKAENLDVSQANAALNNAIVKEETARATAALTIGSGIINDETQAILKEQAAKDDINKAAGFVAAGNDIVEKRVEDIKKQDGIADDALEAAQTAADNAEAAANEASDQLETAKTEAGNVEAAAQSAADAAVEAAGSNTSAGAAVAAGKADAAVKAAEAAKEAADTAVEAAKESAEEADAEAAKAESQAAIAKKAYETAYADYLVAVAEAKTAEAIANQYLKEGAKDAEKATKEAKEAWDKAQKLEKAAEDAKKVADNAVDKAQSELDAAKKELTDATKALEKAVKDEGIAAGEVLFTGLLLNDANKAVEEAQGWVDKVDGQISDDKAKIGELEASIASMKAAKDRLKAELDAEKAEVAELKKTADEDSEILKAKITAVTGAENALKEVEKQLEDALSVLNGAIAAESAKNDEVIAEEGTLKDEAGNATYKGQIYAIEERIAEVNSNDELSDEEKAALIATYEDMMVKVVIGNSFGEATEVTELGGDNKTVTISDKIQNTIFAVGEGDEKTYYTYEVDDEGAIQVYDLTRTEETNTKKVVDTENSQIGLTEDKFNEAVAGLVEGVDYDVVKNPHDAVEGSEAEYTVSYTVTTKEENRDLVKRDDFANTYKDAKDKGYTVFINGKEALSVGRTENFILGEFDSAGKYGYNHSYYVTSDGSWYFIYDDDTFVAVKESTESKENEVVTESELAKLKADDKNSGFTGDVQPTKDAVDAQAAYTTYDVIRYATTVETDLRADELGLTEEEMAALEEIAVGDTFVTNDGTVIVKTAAEVEAVEGKPAVDAKEAIYTVSYTEKVTTTGSRSIQEVSSDDINAGNVYFGNYKVIYHWGKVGYWKTPWEFKHLGNGQVVTGDFTDFVEHEEEQVTESQLNGLKANDNVINRTGFENPTTSAIPAQPAVYPVEGSPAKYQKTTANTVTTTNVSYKYRDDVADGTEGKGYYDYLSSLKDQLAELTGSVNAAQAEVDTIAGVKTVDEETGEVSFTDGTLKTARANLEQANSEKEKAEKAKADADKAYSDKKAEYDKKLAEYNAYYEDKTVKTGWFKTTQYEADKQKLENEITSLEWELFRLATEKITAETKLGVKKLAQEAAKKAHEAALNDFTEATETLILAGIREGKAVVSVGEKEVNLSAAQNAQKIAKDKLAYASAVEDKAEEAYKAAQAAEKVLKDFKGSADVSSAVLKAAKKKVDELKQEYKDAKELAKKAREDADKALKDYQDAVEAVAKLAGLVDAAKESAASAWSAVEAKRLAEEEAARLAREAANSGDSSSSSSNNREVAVISQGVAEQPTLATNPAGRTVRRNTTVAAAVEEVVAGDGEIEETAGGSTVLEDNEVPMADKQTVTIDDNETALSASIPVEDKMSWWWLILVIIAGGTGLEMYRRHQLKKKAAAEVNND